jgi:glyoxylase-like metal-dependent hydrolase (beta-lactamase superfamily II)
MIDSRIRTSVLRPQSEIGSGRVRRFILPDGKTKITQITTFCPDIIGPGATHLYVVEADALILVDAGIPTDLSKAFFYYWRNQPMPPDVAALPPNHSEREFLTGLELAGYRPGDIDALVISHGHLDHFLMARVVTDLGKAKVYAHVLDTPDICNPWALIALWTERQGKIGSAGMPLPHGSNKRIQEALDGGFGADVFRLSVNVDRPLFGEGPLRLNGAASETVSVKRLPGHTKGSVGLSVGRGEEPKVLLCGDVVLHPITPHPDDLLAYLRTMERMGGWADVALTLPAHGKAVHNLPKRTGFIREHHKTRLRKTYDGCAKPRTVWQIAAMRDYFAVYVAPDKFNLLAGTEVLVHVETLVMVGGLVRTEIKDGLHYFVNSGEPFDAVYERVTELVRSSGEALLRC